MQATKTAISWDEFLSAGKEGQRWEWVDGEVAFMTPVNFQHEIILRRLMAYLERFCQAHSDWDWIPSNAVFTMSSGNWRLPDVSLVHKSRYPGGKIPESRADFSPDLAFEILSPSNSPSYIQAKQKDYHESGAIQVWIDPQKRSVELICPDRPIRFFQEDQTLVIDKLPGFSFDLKNLFSA